MVRCCSLLLMLGFLSKKIYGEEEVAAIGRGSKAIVLFTHLRRCGGTYLEEAVLKPHIKRINAGRPLLCKEGDMGRFYRYQEESKLQSFRSALHDAPLVWRHCPFGLHQLLSKSRPYIYLTMLRRPRERMLSWFAYCDKYSPDKCKIGSRLQTRPNESRLLAFYRIRQEKYLASKTKHKAVTSTRQPSTFHADWLEFALDDNYMTRMVCGDQMHDAPIPLPDATLHCAQTNLKEQYAFVGTLESREESICLLSSLLGVPKHTGRKLLYIPHRKGNQRQKASTHSRPINTVSPQLTGPTTNSAAASIPADFVYAFQNYWRLDDQLYSTAANLLEKRLKQHPECSHV